MTTNQRNIIKIENSGQNGGKLTNWTHIHTDNGISESGEDAGEGWHRDGAWWLRGNHLGQYDL